MPGLSRRAATALSVAMLVAACSNRLAPNLGRIAVVPFDTQDTVTATSGFDGDRQKLATEMADMVVLVLTQSGRDATVVLNEFTPADYDTVVTGRITRLDGGNRALRRHPAAIGRGPTPSRHLDAVAAWTGLDLRPGCRSTM